MEMDGRKMIRGLLNQFEETFGNQTNSSLAASEWRTHEPPLEQAPETILAQTVLAGGDTAFVLLDTVGVEILGKQEWHLYEHNTDRRFYGKIVAWALIHPYEGVE
jgi:hypothetical protein